MTLPILPDYRSTDWYGYITALDSAVRSGTGGGSGSVGVISVKDYGAVGNGTTDDSAAFAGAVAAAKAALRTIPYALQFGDKVTTVSIEIPPGDYLITDPGSLLGDETMTVKGGGLRFHGGGKTISNLIFKPATAGVMATNDYWQGLEFLDLGIRAATAGCTFLFTNTTHAAQRYLFRSVTFEGWKYGFNLQGDNNNSEYSFIDVHTLAVQNDGAFFYVGTTNVSDQFLNYWFYGCTHWGTSAPFIDAAAGGHFHIYGLDVSGWGESLTGAGYVFALRGVSHSLGACTFEASGVRVEAKNVNARLLYSEWPHGSVTFHSLDWNSQAFTYTYGDVVSIVYSNTDGPVYTFHDSQLSGGVRIKFAVNDWQHNHRIEFRNCSWLQKNSPTDVVSYDTSGAGGNIWQLPPVEFTGCRGPNNDVYASTGFTTWDATVGYRGQVLQALRPRVLSVRGAFGLASGTETFTVTLPLGATITGVQAMSPAGAVSEGDGGTWTVATTDTTPVTVAAVTVSGAMSAGFDVSTNLAVPFECSTAAKAKLTVKATNVTEPNTKALLLIKGYW